MCEHCLVNRRKKHAIGASRSACGNVREIAKDHFPTTAAEEEWCKLCQNDTSQRCKKCQVRLHNKCFPKFLNSNWFFQFLILWYRCYQRSNLRNYPVLQRTFSFQKTIFVCYLNSFLHIKVNFGFFSFKKIIANWWDELANISIELAKQ